MENVNDVSMGSWLIATSMSVFLFFSSSEFRRSSCFIASSNLGIIAMTSSLGGTSHCLPFKMFMRASW